jgi:replicative DNA helicase
MKRESLTNLDYERAVLATVMLDNRQIDELRIEETLFTRQSHREIWRAMQEVIHDGGVAGYMTVANYVPKHRQEIERIQGQETWGVGHIVSELWELRTLRGLHQLSREISERVTDSDAQSILSEIDSRTLALSEHAAEHYAHIAQATETATEEIEAAYHRSGELSGAPTGLSSLDNMLDGLQDSEMSVIGARPGTGKTAVALQMSKAMSAGDYRVGFFSAEMAGPTLARRLLSQESGIEGSKLRKGFLRNSDFTHLVNAAGRIRGYNIWIDDTPNISIGQLIASARQMRRHEKVNAIMIDYMGLVRHERSDIPRWEQYVDISRRLKGLARELDCPVVVLVQLTRDAEGKRPSLSHIRDAGSIEQDSDVVMFLHPEGALKTSSGGESDTHTRVELILAKQRNGPVGSVPCVFDRARMQFYEVSD